MNDLFVPLLVLVLVFTLVIVFTGMFISSIRFGIPYVPTKRLLVKKMHELADLKKGQTVYDLGCGDGVLLRKFPENQYVLKGVEGDLFVFLWAKLLSYRRSDICYMRQNFFKLSIEDANAVLLYTAPHIMKQIEKKIWPQLKTGTKVISNTFSFPEIEPISVSKVGKVKVFLYVKN